MSTVEPRAVSEKGRAAAMKAVHQAIGEWCAETNLGPLTQNVLVATIVNALISLGWGPRPVCEDREAAIDAYALHLAFGDPEVAKGFRGDAMPVIDWCISQGWGPRPTVNQARLAEFMEDANAGGLTVPWRGLQDYLRECGIEVIQ